MEEKKEVNQEKKKLSYEELENAARQISVQADALYKENLQLKQALQQENMGNLYAELNFKFKVLEYSNMFNPDFVGSIIENIEEIMTPKREQDNKEEGKEE
ncbi:MAG: hypothetical protein IJU02_07270 [Lachnospiraceae bacterium]|nr:hypothetical protein [Lachnospiraceae bacterium]